MDVIHLLPDSVANQIAAGEVIQRPASCLKELVENSLDADATHITIIVVDAGRTLLQVVDNGKGMSEKDALMAFERHATSKIASASDLYGLRTMGFRGEALASICAVAHVELQTRQADSEMGTFIEVAGSRVLRQEPCVCPIGTNFKIKDLFFNVPARRKFLKSDATELRNIMQDFYRIALVYPDVQFTMVHDDEMVMDLAPGTYKQRIEQIFKKNIKTSFIQQFVEIHTETELVNIRGFVGKPEDTTKQTQQYFFVNGRFMRHPVFHKAVMNAYSGLLAADKAPSYFIYFDINPSSIDVNIHPTKTEIKFADEQAIFQILLAAIRESLGKFDIAPSLDFEQEQTLNIPSMPQNPDLVAKPHVNIDSAYNPFSQPSRNYVPSNWKGLYEPNNAQRGSGFNAREFDDMVASASQDTTASQYNIQNPAASQSLELDLQMESTPDNVFQLGERYMMFPTQQGLVVIDQHRASTLILYKQLYQEITASAGVSHQLLFPETLDLSSEESALLLTIKDDLAAVGFDIDALGKTSFVIGGVPPQLEQQNALCVLMNILHNLQETGAGVREQWQKQIVLSLANDAAIPYGRKLSEPEMLQMYSQLLQIENYKYTPDGKTIISLWSLNDIKKLF